MEGMGGCCLADIWTDVTRLKASIPELFAQPLIGKLVPCKLIYMHDVGLKMESFSTNT